MLRDWLHAIRIAVRGLRRRRTLSLAVLFSLALGIGATTAVFSAVHALLLRPLPYVDAARLVRLQPDFIGGDGFRPGQWSYPYFVALRETQDAFEHVAAYAPAAFNVTAVGASERLNAEYASASYLETLGIRVARGRAFGGTEDSAGATAHVGLISQRMWRRNGSPGVPFPLRVDAVPIDIVGVLPGDFRGLTGEADVILPMSLVPVLDAPGRLERMFNHWHFVVARVRDDAVPMLPSRLAAISSRMTEIVPLPDFLPDPRLEVSAHEVARNRAGSTVRAGIAILFSAATLVLLVACVNVANLLLVRTLDRRREMAVRSALGASRASLVGHALLDAALLGIGGAVLGLFLASTCTAQLARLATTIQGGSAWHVLAELDLRLNGAILTFALGVGLGSALASAALPALRTARDLRSAAAGARIDGLPRIRRPTTRSTLVMVQTALAVLLLIGGGLLLRSLHELLRVQTNFDHEQLLTLETQLPRAGIADEAIPALIERLIDRARAVPGVSRVTVDFAGPYSGWNTSRGFRIVGQESSGSAVIAAGACASSRRRSLRGARHAIAPGSRLRCGGPDRSQGSDPRESRCGAFLP